MNEVIEQHGLIVRTYSLRSYGPTPLLLPPGATAVDVIGVNNLPVLMVVADPTKYGSEMRTFHTTYPDIPINAVGQPGECVGELQYIGTIGMNHGGLFVVFEEVG
jgi:hypothetical protein